MAGGTTTLDDPDQLQALTHPTRLRILDALRDPGTAADAARTLHEPRQRINHHVKALAAVGLLVPAGQRRKGSFIEQRYESLAGTFVVSPRLAWGGARVAALADQASLRHLIEFAERVQRDGAALLDRATFDGESIATATATATVHLPDAATRSAFMDEYLRLVGDLIDRHAAAPSEDAPATAETYTVGLVVHPTVEEDR